MNIVRKALSLKEYTEVKLDVGKVNLAMIKHFSENHVADSTKNPDPSSVPSKHMQNATKTYVTVLKNVSSHMYSMVLTKYCVYIYI